MPLTPYPIDRFAGLDLVNDPQELGPSTAVDLLNVDLDHRGRLRTRDGYTNFTASTVGATVVGLHPYYTTGGTKHLIVASLSAGTMTYRAYTTAGASAGAAAATTLTYPGMVRWGSPTAEYAIVLRGGPNGGMSYWDGSSWTNDAGPVVSEVFRCIGVSPIDNRLVIGSGETTLAEASRVRFSNALDPFTFNADDYVDITPGDGERIMAIVPWGNELYVFKETRFAVFTSTATDATGGPIFNYRVVNAGAGPCGHLAWCAARDGIYFLDRKGVYRTTGGVPQLVSGAITPLWFGSLPSSYTGSGLADAYLSNARMAFHQDRLYIAVTTGASTTNDRLFVYDPQSDQWVAWDVPAASLATFRVSDDEELVFGYATGSTHVGRLSPSYTTDAGSAIAWRHQSGAYDLGAPDQEKVIRSSRVTGTGTVTLSRFADYATSDSNAGTVALGVSTPDTTTHSKSWRGTLLSHKLSGSGVAEVRGLVHELRSVRPVGLRSA